VLLFTAAAKPNPEDFADMKNEFNEVMKTVKIQLRFGEARK